MADDPEIRCRPTEDLLHRSFESDGTGGFRHKTSVTGSVDTTPSGLNTDLEITVQSVGTVAAKIPLTPLTDRNFIMIHNKGPSTLYIGESDVTADDTATGGWEIASGQVFVVDIRDDLEIYGVVASGSNTVKIFEGA